MKSKLHPIFIIVGLFLFKVGILDNMRNIGHHHQEHTRYVASAGPAANALRPIR